MKIWKLACLVACGAVLGACGSGASNASSSGGASSGGAPGLKVGVVFDSGGRGDKSFNDSAWEGVQRAEKELNLASGDVKTVDSRSEKDYETNLMGLSDAGCNLIFAVGISQADALQAVAPKYPNIHYAIIDADVTLPNVRSIVFSEEQGSFLAGYLAGLVSKTGTIGFVGGKKIPLIEKFQAGYEAGAVTANPKIQLLPAKYTESWDDTSMGKAAAQTLFNGGADIVYSAAGRCGLGVIDAAKEAGKFAIGVDQDQDYVAPGTVLTSMVKHVDEAVFQTIKDAQNGKFTPGLKRYDLASNGVGLTNFQYTKDKIGPANIAKVDAIAKDIVSGKIKVPATPADEQAYAATLGKH